MKKTLLILIAFVLLFNLADAQWVPLTTGSGGSYESIFFFGADTGWASSSGNVIRTTNGGVTWSSTNGVFGLRDVEFANHSTGYTAGVVGNSIKKSTDGGGTWTALTPVNSNSLWGVSVVSTTTVYVCGTGGVLWKSTNGGSSFTAVNLPTTDLIPDLDFVDANTGFAADQLSKIWKTTNGGTSWSAVFSSTGIFFTSLYFVDATTGFAVANNGVVIRTTDGGTGWTTLNTGSLASLQYVHFCDVNNGMAVGFDGAAIRTTDGGNTWFAENTGTTVDLYSCYLISPTVAIVAGDSGVMRKNSNLLTGVPVAQTSLLKVNCFPDPFNSNFNIIFSDVSGIQNAVLVIYKDMGMPIYKMGVYKNGEINIDASGWDAGCYLYAILQDDKIIKRGKIVKVE
ncbi:MAG TPA: YCF48-related protein [Chitinophagales bacterium]|nr:YCF48-related protein [Chitinophagales bacterium]